MTTETITITVTRTTYDGTPETLPEPGVGVFYFFVPRRCKEGVIASFYSDGDGDCKWYGKGIFLDPTPGDIWFPISDLAQIATAKPDEEWRTVYGDGLPAFGRDVIIQRACDDEECRAYLAPEGDGEPGDWVAGIEWVSTIDVKRVFGVHFGDKWRYTKEGE